MRDSLRALPSLEGPFPAFDIGSAPEDPLALFTEWLDTAIKAGISEAHALTLSTVDKDGRPDARVVILKDIDQDGWHFATMRTAPKGRQIYTNSNVALTFYWQELGRQVRIRGVALDVGAAARNADFRARSFEARSRGMVGRQSEVLESEQELLDSVAERTRRLTENPDEVPANWAVYVVHGSEIEFWQANASRLHTRLRYRRDREGRGGWLRERLWP